MQNLSFDYSLGIYLLSIFFKDYRRPRVWPSTLISTLVSNQCWPFWIKLCRVLELNFPSFPLKQSFHETLPCTGDLYKLGFIPEGAPDPLTSGLVEPLSRILKQLSKGGGAKEINIEEVSLLPPILPLRPSIRFEQHSMVYPWFHMPFTMLPKARGKFEGCPLISFYWRSFLVTSLSLLHATLPSFYVAQGIATYYCYLYSYAVGACHAHYPAAVACSDLRHSAVKTRLSPRSCSVASMWHLYLAGHCRDGGPDRGLPLPNTKLFCPHPTCLQCHWRHCSQIWP